MSLWGYTGVMALFNPLSPQVVSHLHICQNVDFGNKFQICELQGELFKLYDTAISMNQCHGLCFNRVTDNSTSSFTSTVQTRYRL